MLILPANSNDIERLRLVIDELRSVAQSMTVPNSNKAAVIADCIDELEKVVTGIGYMEQRIDDLKNELQRAEDGWYREISNCDALGGEIRELEDKLATLKAKVAREGVADG